ESLTKFLIRYAENCAILNARQSVQHCLDLCRVNINAARNHHVALAITDEQVSLLIEVTHIPDRDQTIAFYRGTTIWRVSIGECGIAIATPVDLANLASRQWGPVIAVDAQLRTGRTATNRAGLSQEIFAVGESKRAGLCTPIKFKEYRTPPFD